MPRPSLTDGTGGVRGAESPSDAARGAAGVGVDASVRTSSTVLDGIGSVGLASLAPQFPQKFFPGSTCLPHSVQNMSTYLRKINARCRAIWAEH